MLAAPPEPDSIIETAASIAARTALIQNKRVDWDTHTIGIPGHTTKDKENRRIPSDPNGRFAAILRRHAKLGPNAFVFGTENGEFVANFKTAWESLLLVANGHETKRPASSRRSATWTSPTKSYEGLEISWRRRSLKAVSGGSNG